MDNIQIEKILRLIIKELNDRNNISGTGVKLCVVSQKHRANIFTIALTIMQTTLMGEYKWPTMDEVYNIGEITVKEADLIFSINKERTNLGTVSLHDSDFDEKICKILSEMVRFYKL